MNAKSNKVNDLLATIQRKVSAAAPEPAPELAQDEPTPAAAIHKKTKASAPRKAAHKLQFYLHDDDRRTIRELSAWLAGQGIRASDSLIIRSALQLTRTGGDLLKTYRQLAERDGRLKHRK